MHSDNVNGAARARPPFKFNVIAEVSRTFLRFRFVETAKKKKSLSNEKFPNNEKWKRYFSHFYALQALEAFKT